MRSVYSVLTLSGLALWAFVALPEDSWAQG